MVLGSAQEVAKNQETKTKLKTRILNPKLCNGESMEKKLENEMHTRVM